MNKIELTREEVEMVVKSAVRDNELIAFRIDWIGWRRFEVKVITRGKFYETNKTRIGVGEYQFSIEDEATYSEYLGVKTRLKFSVSSGSNWSTSLEDYFEPIDRD